MTVPMPTLRMRLVRADSLSMKIFSSSKKMSVAGFSVKTWEHPLGFG
jgi:hypothetical protein